jgi:NitT/TauT family transport system substrate-binding protein
MIVLSKEFAMPAVRPFARLLIALALAAPFAAQAQEKIRVGLLPFSESLGAVLADKQGFFKAEGLEIEVTKINSGAVGVPVLQAGKLDIIFSNTVSTLQAIEQGLDAVILAPGAAVRASGADTTIGLMVRKGSFKNVKELEGKRVAVNVINSTAWLHAIAHLDAKGVDRSKVRFLEVPFPQMNDPLLNEQVDAIYQVEPFRSVLMATGKAEVLGYPYVETLPNSDITQYIALTPWVEKHRATAIKFARAIIKGAQFANANEAATRDANLQFTGLNPALKDTVMLPRFGTSVSAAEIARTQDMMIKYGMMKTKVDLSKRILALP